MTERSHTAVAGVEVWRKNRTQRSAFSQMFHVAHSKHLNPFSAKPVNDAG